MYCIQCGVKLADTEKKCPLCQTAVFHPELTQPEAQPLYPREQYPAQQVSSKAVHVVLIALFLLPAVITFLCDLQAGGGVTWSGYVIGALALTYILIVLPFWFQKPNPVVFVPCDFAAVAVFLLYIDLATRGGWFLSFAFPVVGVLALVVTAVVALCKYVRRGELYIFGGAFLALAAFMPVMGYLVNMTFFTPGFAFWSLFPTVALGVLGGMLIFLAICRPARETMHRKFFI